jgi:hypothetical protein
VRQAEKNDLLMSQMLNTGGQLSPSIRLIGQKHQKTHDKLGASCSIA